MEYADNLPLDGWSQILHARNQLLDQEALLQRILSLEELPDEFFVYHRDLHTCRRILVGEVASADQPDAEGLEVVRRYHPKAACGPLRWIGKGRRARDHERHAEARSLQWRPCLRRSSDDSRHSIDARQQLPVVRCNQHRIL